MNSTCSLEHRQFLRNIRRRKRLVVLCQISLLAAFFAAWEGAVRLGWLEAFIFSSPTRMWNMLNTMASSGELFHHIFTTSWQVVAGFVIGSFLGIAISIALWWNDFLHRVLSPYLVVFNSLPKTALAPIIIVWLGNNPRAVVVTALLISVVVTVLNVLAGFMQVDEDKIKLAESFGAKKRQILAKVVFPASIPDILNALKINIGLTFVGVIVGEFLVAQAGLGFLIIYGSQIFRMDMVMLSILILCALAAVFYGLVVALEKMYRNQF